ncbi:AAA ATPase midasin, partial [Coemansia erecta]
MASIDHPSERRELDSVKRGLARLELATPAADSNTEALALDDAQAVSGRAEQRSFEQSIAITDVDPLSIDLPRTIACLATQLAHEGIAVPASAAQLFAKVTQTAVTAATADAVLTDIAGLLLAEGTALDAVASQLAEDNAGAQADWADGRFTLMVGAVFRPILVELASRWTQAAAPMAAATAHAAVAYASSLLVGTAPQIGSLAMAFFEQHAPAQCLAQTAADAAARGEHRRAVALAAVGVRLLRRLPACAAQPAAWDWASAWTQLMAPATAQPAARLLATEGLAAVRGLTDAGRAQLADGAGVADALAVRVRTWLRLGARRLDAHAQRLMARLGREALAQGLWRALDAGAPHAWLPERRLSSGVASVGGVLLHAQAGAARDDGGFVVTPTVARSAHALALATSRREPVLLAGAPGAGKTALVEWAARRTGHELVTIHLSSSVDAKTLVGSYVTTQRAGDFEWRAGLLTQAVRLGRWVLVEDIDGAAADVAQTLAPLLESQRLFVPSRGEEVPAHVRFRMFATVGTQAGARAGGLLASSAWTRVHVAAPGGAEAALVVGGVHAALRGAAAEQLAAAFARVAAALGADAAAGAAAALTTRDLLAWCARLLAFGGAGDAFRAFVEAADAFAMREPDYARWRQQLRALGAALGVAAARVDQHVDQHVPAITRAAMHVRVGRARLDCPATPTSAAAAGGASRGPFAETRHARSLLERIACCVQLGAPVLLAGETGTGKTTVVQQLAALAGRPLAVFNLSQQSDASDLLGGFRPVDTAAVALRLREAFDALFARTASARKNAAFLDSVRQAHARRDWRRLARLFHAAVQMADEMLARAQAAAGTSGASKKARLAADQAGPLAAAWRDFAARVAAFDAVRGARVAFAFAEGALVAAARTGGWILLDEANLATAETLACLGGLLQPPAARSLLLAETGERVPCHPDFRLFACMNPATDVGKRDLPAGLRRAFAEFFVHPPDAAPDDLLAIVRAHLPQGAPEHAARGVIAFYAAAKRLAAEHRLVDGGGARPHYSLRTLTRALTFAREHAPAYSLRRALVDGLAMTFATQLDAASQALVLAALAEHVVPGAGGLTGALLAHVPPAPHADAVLVEGFWLRRGAELPEPAAAAEPPFVATPSVAAKLRGLARAAMCGRYPVLIQGPTSAGKTSMVAHLAHVTGHRF